MGTSEKLRIETLETDVLCVGGGIAGLNAAIRASELGAKVIVAEKSNTLRSGDGGMGCDHFRCYIPEIHGHDVDAILDDFLTPQMARISSRAFLRTLAEKSFELVQLWDSWGIPMKYEGRYEFSGHGYSDRPQFSLRYSGQNQKPVLTKEALKRGAKIMNRLMIFDLLSEDGVISGALGIDTREARLIVIKAKSVILATGRAMRLYPAATPGWMFNTNTSPQNTGEGRVMAYRAGAELANIELTARWSGIRYFARNGKGSWHGVLKDPQGKPIGPFITKPSRYTTDMTLNIYREIFDDYAKSGKGPVYMDFQGITDEDFEYMKYWLIHEANTPILDYFEKEGIDIREHPIEFMTFGMFSVGGINFNEKGETCVKGLYAAGDEYPQTFIVGAAVIGRIAGENAANYAKGIKEPDLEKARGKINKTEDMLNEILSRDAGANWYEVNVALQQIMSDFAGLIRSETMLEAGLAYIKRLKKKAYDAIKADNQHELMRCLEVLGMFDLGELLMIAAKERKETRGGHKRADFPYTNPMLNGKSLIIKQRDNKPVTEWRKID